MDFVEAGVRNRKNIIEIYPKFKILPSKDLMIRGNKFYAAYDETTGLWTKNEWIIQEKIDKLIYDKAHTYDIPCIPLYLKDAETNMIDLWHKYCEKQMRDNVQQLGQLDSKIIFSNQEVTREDYATKRLSYPLEKGSTEAYDQLMNVLYSPEERHKIEWAIGAVITGDSKMIQKFIVLYGAAGTGKSTVLNIIRSLFDGYCGVFDSKALGNANNAYALESFKDNPLVAIQDDGDLSRVEDNTKLNSLVSHEKMSVNEKYKSLYEMKFDCFLFMGTNKPVKITDAKSGLLRRLIDVRPTGEKVHPMTYKKLMKQISFELGAIAYHCRDVYLENPGIYDYYTPLDMMEKTNNTFFFIKDNYFLFKNSDSIKLDIAWQMYKNYCEEAKIPYPLSKPDFKEEFANYWERYENKVYYTFLKDKVDLEEKLKKDLEKKQAKIASEDWLELNAPRSLLDIEFETFPAQYANEEGKPKEAWEKVKTTLKDINTSKEHYVNCPEKYIVVDFDLKDKDGNKCLKLNLEAASKWPKTYAEVSKSGQGLHLHYIYNGDTSKLCRLYEENIEIKVFSGNQALRRKVTKCNDIPLSPISTGLPLREDKKVINKDVIQNEKTIRTAIRRAIMKDIHPDTTSNINFIKKVLDDAYEADIKYDVSDLKQDVMIFASLSSHQSKYCIQTVDTMHFEGKQEIESVKASDDLPLAVFDCEVFKNLFVVVVKELGEGKPFLKYINPSQDAIYELIHRYRLIGFNCIEYDNHILYARMLGYSLMDLYMLSQRIISKDNTAKFRDAKNLSYTDIYDFCREKMSLKKWEIKLRILHSELGLDWNLPVPEEMWTKVVEYCCNDVNATEAVWNDKSVNADFIAREILAELTDSSVNDTTNTLTTRFIFGKEKHPNLVYTHLEDTFPGYEFREMRDDEAPLNGLKQAPRGSRNMFRGVDLGFGGYVYANPGIYYNVALLDVASLHPHSALAMHYFGDYDQKFRDLVEARIYIKHKEFDKLATLCDGKFAKYAKDPSQAKALAGALKLAINSVYGLTSASFDNPFKIKENVNNIIALRGALFMKTLQDEVEAMGYTVVHIKTDSIKIANADKKIIDYCMQRAKDYEYTFEHEATYDRICLVNNAVYIAKFATLDKCIGLYSNEYVMSDKDICKENKEEGGLWTATGTQFMIPYTFKTLFSEEALEFDDYCLTKSVQTAIYMDFNEDLPETEHRYVFVGKVGYFVPVISGVGGGYIYRVSTDKDGNIKYDSVTGTKIKGTKNGLYRFYESEAVRGRNEHWVNKSYWQVIAEEALDEINKYGDSEVFRAA